MLLQVCSFVIIMPNRILLFAIGWIFLWKIIEYCLVIVELLACEVSKLWDVCAFVCESGEKCMYRRFCKRLIISSGFVDGEKS